MQAVLRTCATDTVQLARPAEGNISQSLASRASYTTLQGYCGISPGISDQNFQHINGRQALLQKFHQVIENNLTHTSPNSSRAAHTFNPNKPTPLINVPRAHTPPPPPPPFLTLDLSKKSMASAICRANKNKSRLASGSLSGATKGRLLMV